MEAHWTFPQKPLFAVSAVDDFHRQAPSQLRSQVPRQSEDADDDEIKGHDETQQAWLY
jgi:hypothetical protein